MGLAVDENKLAIRVGEELDQKFRQILVENPPTQILSTAIGKVLEANPPSGMLSEAADKILVTHPPAEILATAVKLILEENPLAGVLLPVLSRLLQNGMEFSGTVGGVKFELILRSCVKVEPEEATS